MEINFEERLKTVSEIAEATTEIVHTKGFQYISQMEDVFNKGNALLQLLVEAAENREELQEHLERWNKALEVSVDGNYYAINTSISRQRYETYKSLVKANGSTVSAMTAELINKYIDEHVDEITLTK